MNTDSGLRPLGRILETYRFGEGWTKARVEWDEVMGASRLISGLDIEGRQHHVAIDAFEEARYLRVCIQTVFGVLEEKVPDACRFFNYINENYQFHGRLSVDDGGGRIRYIQYTYLEGLEPSAAMVRNMMESGTGLLGEKHEALAAIALTDSTYEEVRRRCDEEEAEWRRQWAASREGE